MRVINLYLKKKYYQIIYLWLIVSFDFFLIAQVQLK